MDEVYKTLKKKLDIPEPEVIEDHTNGRKPGKGEEVVTFRFIIGKEYSKTAYKVIGKKPKPPQTKAERERIIRQNARSNALLFDYMFFGPGQGAGYYFK